MSSFLNAAGFSINSLVIRLHHTAPQDLWGWPAWWKVHGRCCTGPRSGYNNLCKNVLANIATLDMKPQLWAQFSILSHWFNISSSQNAQEAGPYIWRSHHKKETAFISCKWPHSLCKFGASIPFEDVHPAGWTWARRNSILIQRKTSLPSHAATGSGVATFELV